MCGVVAFFSPFPTPEHVGLLGNLFTESKVRGLHAFGYATSAEGGWNVRKQPTLKACWDDLSHEPPFRGLIGHTRYSTSGDWNKEENNQPICSGGTAMVLNGVISMKSKYDYSQEQGQEFNTENDAEIFAWLTDKKDRDPAIMARWKQMLLGHQSIAAAWMNDDGHVYVVRNQRRPLWTTYHQGAIFVASTSDILKRSGLPRGILIPERTVVRLSQYLT